jgi:hypothetical protein
MQANQMIVRRIIPQLPEQANLHLLIPYLSTEQQASCPESTRAGRAGNAHDVVMVILFYTQNDGSHVEASNTWQYCMLMAWPGRAMT